VHPLAEAQEAARERYAPRDPLAAEPAQRTVYRLRPRPRDGALSARVAAMLDDEQRAAVEGLGDRTLVLAAAGSGKTRVIVAAVAHLVERGVEPRRIMLVTFTRRAAREMTLRAQRVAGRPLEEMTAGTFHSVCQRILRRHGALVGLPGRFSVLDGEDQAETIRMARDEVLAGRDTRPSLPRPEWLAGVAALAAETGRPLAEVITEANPRLADRVVDLVAIADAYAERKRRAGAVDYADLLVLTERLVREHPGVRRRLAAEHTWVLVDELHDANAPQSALVEALASEGSRVMAVADPDQSIYAWRGADPEVVARFAAVPGTRVAPLGRNYRSTPEIVALAQATLPGGNPWGKRLVADRPARGARPVVAHCMGVADEAAFVTQRIADLITEGREPGEIGVLYRAHHHSVDLQLALTEAGVEFELHSGARFVESAHIKDVLAFCRLRHNPRDELAWHRALRQFERVGERTAGRGAVAAASAATGGDLAEALAALAGHGGALGRAADAIGAVVAPPRPEDLVLAVARADWFRDRLRTRYDNWRDREGDLARLAEIAVRYADLERFLADLALAERVESDEDVSGPARRVALSSVHQAKGLEWPVVFVLQVEAGSFPSSWALSEGRLDEEERLFHVAVTRARDELYLCRPIEARRPWDTGADRVVMNAGLGFLDGDLGALVEEWSVR
jgi:DNA helicase-2/ATP-dependent DNA helicase PcrA